MPEWNLNNIYEGFTRNRAGKCEAKILIVQVYGGYAGPNILGSSKCLIKAGWKEVVDERWIVKL